jgi:hypothetical protein
MTLLLLLRRQLFHVAPGTSPQPAWYRFTRSTQFSGTVEVNSTPGPLPCWRACQATTPSSAGLESPT